MHLFTLVAEVTQTQTPQQGRSSLQRVPHSRPKPIQSPLEYNVTKPSSILLNTGNVPPALTEGRKPSLEYTTRPTYLPTHPPTVVRVIITWIELSVL